MIGIDRVILNKSEVKNFDLLEKKEVCSASMFSQYLEKSGDGYEFEYSHNLSLNSKEYSNSVLDFNPNNILYGSNEKNSSIAEFRRALRTIENDLLEKRVEVDLSESGFRYIEINKNLNIDFDTIQEFLLAVGRANFKKAFGQHSFQEEDIPRYIKKDRTLYINLRDTPCNFEKPETLAMLVIYDKRYELKVKKGKDIGYPLTRVELKCGRDFYREEVRKLGYDNSLNTLLKNPDILEKLFKPKVEKYIFQETEKYIETILKPNLEHDFISFKREEKRKRIARRKLHEQGKEVPYGLREERGVFKYLEENSWIFDASFLKEVVIDNMESKHRKRNIDHIEVKYGHLKNYKLLKKISNDLL